MQEPTEDQVTRKPSEVDAVFLHSRRNRKETGEDLLKLSNFLAEVFSQEDLQGFIAATFGRSVYHQLPRGASTAETVDNAISLLERHGLIAEPFFVALLQRFPFLVDRILEIAHYWCPTEVVNSFTKLRAAPTTRGPHEMAPEHYAAKMGLTCRVAAECVGWRASRNGELSRTAAELFSDPVFDLTLLNRGNSPILLTGFGVFVERLAHPGRRPVADLSPTVAFQMPEYEPRQISVFGIVKISVPYFNRLQGRKPHEWQEKRQEISRTFFAEFDSPVLFPAQAAIRYNVALCGLLRSFSICATVRLSILTDAGVVRSPSLELKS